MTLSSGTATRRFEVDHPTAAGHFPGNPIIPGAVLLREIIAAIYPAGMEPGLEIRSAKFHQPVRPGDAMVIAWQPLDGEEIRFSCSLAGSDRPTVTGVLRRRLS